MTDPTTSSPTTTTTTTATTTTITKSHHQQQEPPAFPTTANNLQDLVAYTSHPSGHGLISKTSLAPGTLFSRITAYTHSPRPQWHTLQTSARSHISLDSAFTYLNHSCNPTLEIDTENMEIRVARGKKEGLKEGEGLSFFYPSTEWRMDRGFACLCGEEGCVGEVTGAEGMSEEELERWFINGYIWELVKERERDGGKKSRKKASET